MIDFDRLFAAGLPAPAGPWQGFPPFNFVGGNNDPEAVPVEELAEAAARAIRREGKSLAIYNLGTGGLGHPGLRRFIAGKLAGQRGIDVDPDRILVTSGSGQGLDLVNHVLLEPGDTVVMEQMTYSGAIGKVKRLGAKVVGAPLDAEGIDIGALEGILERLRDQGVRPKYLYTIPTIQNPTGSVLSPERRRALLEVTARHGVPIFEDECYADLLWEGEWPPALRGMPGGEQVIHVGSFSKSLAPALRLGYVTAPPSVMGRLLACKTDGGTPAVEQMMVAEYFGSHFDEHVTRLKRRLREKLSVLVDALEEQFGTAAEFRLPKGGIFLWVRLPEAVDTGRLAATALAEGVAYNPGPEWTTDPEAARHCLRLCFALPSEQELRDGVAKLAEICHRETGVPLRGGNLER